MWSEELALYLFIWVAFLGWIVATERRSHIAITQFSDARRPRLQQVLGWLGDIGTLVLMVLLFWFGVKLVANNRDVETRDAVLQLRGGLCDSARRSAGDWRVHWAIRPVLPDVRSAWCIRATMGAAVTTTDAGDSGGVVCAAVQRRADLCA